VVNSDFINSKTFDLDNPRRGIAIAVQGTKNNDIPNGFVVSKNTGLADSTCRAGDGDCFYCPGACFRSLLVSFSVSANDKNDILEVKSSKGGAAQRVIGYLKDKKCKKGCYMDFPTLVRADGSYSYDMRRPGGSSSGSISANFQDVGSLACSQKAPKVTINGKSVAIRN